MNVQQRIGGDSDLSRRGWAYARKLPEYFAKELPPDLQMTVWTSTFKRTRQTGQFLPYPHVEWRALDELDAGVCDGLTYEEIEVRRRARTRARWVRRSLTPIAPALPWWRRGAAAEAVPGGFCQARRGQAQLPLPGR